ncbi:hypothetical protein J9317_18080 [Metabacillus sp. KIGAM252]|uniref:Lipoprotein YvcA n=1 Tax=Metabacillus flavus TaxID=2823519 RepID=A0ABS5LJ76_9BACI|nr:hypothetical protein [Metabacillus flavus]MBS2970656.1 hypothetical protein [Metabacillus flavus]
MKLNKSIYAIFSLLIIGGCGKSEKVSEGKSGQKESIQQETPALKDDFTKEYLTSTKEVEKGFYQFKSKTGGYTMLLPVEAVISKDFGNQLDEDFYEAIIYGAEIDQASIDTQITYENNPITKNIEENLELLSSSSGYKDSYSESKEDSKTIYYGKETMESEDYTTYKYISYIKGNRSDQAVRFIYGASCKKSNESCGGNAEEQERIAKKIIHSITFNRK